jgi:TonB family protein
VVTVLFRNCLIGSVILHAAFLAVADFCLPRPGLVPPSEAYLQIYYEPENKPQIISTQVLRPANASKSDLFTASGGAPSRPKQPKLTIEPERPAGNVNKRESVVNQTVVTRNVNEPKNVANQTVAAIAASVQAAMLSKGEEADSAAVGKAEVFNPNSPEQLPGTSDKGIVTSGVSAPETKSGCGPAVELSGTDNDGLVETDLTDVDVPTVRLNCPRPRYPSKAKNFNWEGTVVLEGEIKTNGLVGKVKVAKSSGYDVLDQEARLTVKCWRYRPALKDGKPIICHKRISVTFKLED